MNKFIINFFILILIISTTVVCVYKPKTHKPIVFENKNFKISMMTEKTNANIQNVEIQMETPNIDINPPKIKVDIPEIKIDVNIPQTQIQQAQNNKQKANTTSQTNKNQQQVKQQTKTNNNSKTEQKNNKQNQPNKKVIDNIQNNKIQKQEIAPKVEQKAQEEKIIPKKQDKTEVIQPKQEKVLTEQEEIIAWNKWRSDLQNKLMKDSKITAPMGTSFMFSFTVDKYGNITNLKTWSSNPSYTPMAVRIIKPLLLSYQKTYILKFPEGSKRIITNANGGFTMASATRYSSPSDYNDYERVRK